jgi:hypothetical protein
MADIFISYAQADRDWVEKLARQIEREGFSVWWDIKVLPGDEFGDLVVKEIASSKCVIVVWSEHSVRSDWVYGEADEARRTKKLVPVIKDEVQLPTAFRKIHAANFSQWDPQTGSPEFAILLDAIRGRVKHALETGGQISSAEIDPRLQAPSPYRAAYAPVPAGPAPGSLEAAVANALNSVAQLNKVTLRIISVLAIVLIAIKHITYFESPLLDFWNLYWTASEWAYAGIFAVLAFSNKTHMPQLVRLFLAVAALLCAVQIANIFSLDRPPPALLPYFVTYVGNLALFAAIAFSYSAALAQRLRPFALVAIACWVLLDISDTTLTDNANSIVWFSAFLMRHVLEVIVVCMAPLQFAPLRRA